jgi:ATP-binding cassette, subfamily B, bacterial
MSLNSISDKQMPETAIPTSPFAFILHITRPFRWTSVGAITAVVVASAFSQGTSYFFKLIVDASEAGDYTRVLTYVLMYPVAIFFVQILYRLSGLLGGAWTTNAKKYAGDVLVRYLLNHSHTYFTNRFSGSLLSKVNNVIGAIEQFIPDLLWTHLSAIVSFLITAVVMWRADMFSGILFIILICVLVGTNRLFAPKKRIISYRTSELGTKLRGIIVDIFSNISATRQYVRTEDEIERVKEASELHREWSRKNWYFTELMLSVNTLILFIFSAVIFYLLVERWAQGSLGTGDFVFILALYSQITGTLLFIGRAFNNTARSFGEMEEGLEEILTPYEIIDSPSAYPLPLTKGEIGWESVTFSYGENDVFKDFNLTIRGGERIGLVGSSGAGKSTFVSLLLRQHEVSKGRIAIDGHNIAEVTQDSLREHISVVPQEPMLFHRTIRENIAYGKPNTSLEEIIEVAKKAEAHDFIMSLKQGYETLVGERGVKLSGGQKQRIAIARAILKNAPILILDEATSALDSESEVAIQKALHELMSGKTVIAIAHRLSTLREMDRIIVLEEGKIIEDGTHEKLSKKRGGVYARLWKHQAGGFLVK